MPRPPSPPERYDSMRARAGFGLPVPHGTRWRLPKRLLAKLCWPLLRSQVELNWEVLAELVRHDDILLDVLWDRDLLREQVELVHQQSFARLNDAVGTIRSELDEVVQQMRGEMAGEAEANAEMRARFAKLQARINQDQIRLAQIDLLLNRVRHSLPEPPSVEEFARLPGAFENLYVAFVEAFRGPARRSRSGCAPTSTTSPGSTPPCRWSTSAAGGGSSSSCSPSPASPPTASRPIRTTSNPPRDWESTSGSPRRRSTWPA